MPVIDPSTVPGAVVVPLWLFATLYGVLILAMGALWKTHRADTKETNAAHKAELKEERAFADKLADSNNRLTDAVERLLRKSEGAK